MKNLNEQQQFFYISTINEFLSFNKKNRIDEVVETMCNNAQESGILCGDREIESWKKFLMLLMSYCF